MISPPFHCAMHIILLLCLTGSLLLVLSMITKESGLAAASLVVFLLHTMPGHCAVYPLYYRKRKIVEGVIWGTLSGAAISAFLISIIVYGIGWNMQAVFLVTVIIPLALLCGLFGKGGIEKGARKHDRSFFTVLFAVLIVCVLFFYAPFKNLGALINDKYIFTWLFGHDFINRLVHVLSASRGLPLDSYFFAGEKLSYYWLSYIYPALLYKLFPVGLTLQNTLQLALVWYSLLTAAAFCVFLAGFITERKTLIILCIMTFLSYSYMHFYYFGSMLLKTVAGGGVFWQGHSLDSFAGFSHSLYRFFMVEPQGVLGIGIVLFLIALYNNDEKSAYISALFGLLLGLLFGVEATMGIILGLWFFCMACWKLWLSGKDRGRVLREHFVSVVAAGVVYLCLFGIEMYSLHAGQGVLRIKANLFPLLFAPLYFPLEYGPAFLLGIAGLAIAVKHKEAPGHWIHQFIILLAICLFFVFFIVNPTESQFGLLKATRIIPLCLLMSAAYYFQHRGSFMRRKWIVALLLLAALPTYFSDNLIASDINNVHSTYIRSADLGTCQWIKKNLPLKAVVQAEPNYPGIDGRYIPSYYYSLVPIFAERRTGVGEWKVSGLEHGKGGSIDERFHDIKRMFATTDVRESIQILKKYGIDYVYVGTLEHALYEEGVLKFGQNQKLFRKVYSLSDIEVYEFVPSGDAEGAL